MYAFPDPLVAAYRNSVVHLSLISVLDAKVLNWCRQEVLSAQMSNMLLFGKKRIPSWWCFTSGGTCNAGWGKI